MKLELKHLAPYLPYGLRIQDGWGDIQKLRPIHLEETSPIVLRPILRPLSDLEYTKFEFENDEYVIDKESSSELCWDEWTFLFENHFDVFGLIEKGLAININTLEV